MRSANELIGIIVESGLNDYYTQMTDFLQLLKNNWPGKGNAADTSADALDLDFLWESIGCGLMLAAIVFCLELLFGAIRSFR